MSAGSPSAYFHHPQAGLRGVARDCSGRSVPSPAPFWTVPHSSSANRPKETESMYPRLPHAGGGSIQHRHASASVASPPPVLQPLQRTEMRSASIHLHAAAAVAAVPFPGPAGHAPQAARVPDASMRQLDYSQPESSPFRVSPNLSANLRSLGKLDSSSHDIADVSALGFTPTNEARGEVVGIAFAPQAQLSLLPRVCSWGSSVSNDMDMSSVEPAHPQNADDDTSDDVYTFLCEWTDEHGTCNMDILGDRVWMSHHLSRYHSVVGNEKSQRACLWRGCTDTMNKGSLARHVVSRHLRAGASCGFCSKVYSRADVARRHTKKCKAANGVSVKDERARW